MRNFFSLSGLILLLDFLQKGVRAEEHGGKKMYVYTEEPAVVDYHGSDKYMFWLDENGRANVAPQEMYNQGMQGQVMPTFSQQQYAPQMTPAPQYVEPSIIQPAPQYVEPSIIQPAQPVVPATIIQPAQQTTDAAIIQPAQQTGGSDKTKEKDSKGSSGSSKDSKSKDDKDGKSSKDSSTASSRAKKNSCTRIVNKYTLGLTVGTLLYTFIN